MTDLLRGETKTAARLLGTISLSGPTNARPVARMRFSPLAVSGMSVTLVCRPLSDHSVSPWRMRNNLGTGGPILFAIIDKETSSRCAEIYRLDANELMLPVRVW